MRHRIILLSLMTMGSLSTFSQNATVEERMESMKTYPFSDPNPIPNPDNLYYPYFRFDGFSAKGIDKEWKTVCLENDYLKVVLFPEVGGKIWGATDKTSGKDFIYNNHVVKFRDIAMRGPWTSGGVELNFGIIGHAPTTSTPIDYYVDKKKDGSVSCYISSYDWVTRTFWNVEVNLPKDKAYFTTNTTWYNQSGLDQPYYQWMNAGYPAKGNAKFCYPGDKFIGHNGEVGSFPLDEEGRDLSWYEKNDFGGSKSEHVLGYYNDYYGVYWHDDDYGSIHHSDYDSKLGMKIFIWGLSRSGAIWEDLLTDNDGQYIELQSGRMYNQPSSGSSYSPYKQYSFTPGATDSWTEYWFPIKDIQGVSKASRIGALNVSRENGSLKLAFSPTVSGPTEIKLYKGTQLTKTIPVRLKAMEALNVSVPLSEAAPEGILRVVIGNDDLVYTEYETDYKLARPSYLPSDYDWNSVEGLSTQGEQWMNQKVYDKAEKYLTEALSKDKYHMPSLKRLASLYIRQGKENEALSLLTTALSLNTYDGEANYLYGVCNNALGKTADAKDGFSIAGYSAEYRSPAYANLAAIYLAEGSYDKAEHYALKSLKYNDTNLDAKHILSVVYRESGQTDKAEQQITDVLSVAPMYHPMRYEKYLLSKNADSKNEFSSMVRNELKDESFIEMADWYQSIGRNKEAVELLSFASENPMALYKQAYLTDLLGDASTAKDILKKANEASPDMVFPFRANDLKTLAWAAETIPSWKNTYYQALIYWANQNKDKALELLSECDAAYVPLLLSRASLNSGEAKLADLLKAQSVKKDWRVGMALLNYYANAGEWSKAAETGTTYNKMYPSNYYIGLKYAEALYKTGKYDKCVSLLKNMEVLPNEGAYAGKNVYRNANLYQAVELLNKKNPKKATVYIEASKEWPENLGVGKPYDYLIDTRLEDYLTAIADEMGGNAAKANEIYASIAEKPVSDKYFNSLDLLTALSMSKSGKKAEADELAANWQKQHADNVAAQWCAAIYNGDVNKANSLSQPKSEGGETTPWEASFKDNNFAIITKAASILK